MVGNFDFLKGNIETIILNALYGGDKYGYDITREIKEKTDNQYEIKQPTLYGYLKNSNLKINRVVLGRRIQRRTEKILQTHSKRKRALYRI